MCFRGSCAGWAACHRILCVGLRGEAHDRWRSVGIHVLAGAVLLWLFDPRPAVEVAAAADSVARRLFGEKAPSPPSYGPSLSLYCHT